MKSAGVRPERAKSASIKAVAGSDTALMLLSFVLGILLFHAAMTATRLAKQALQGRLQTTLAPPIVASCLKSNLLGSQSTLRLPLMS
jgi:hypothetical protein